MKVLVLHSLPPAVTSPGRAQSEFDLGEAAANIASALPNATIAGVRGEAAEILATIAIHQPDAVFNLCEAPLGRPELEGHVAALFEWIGMRFTGCGSETLNLCRRKDRTKAVLTAAGVNVPGAARFPRIVKPADQDGSVGIDALSICDDADAVRRAVARLAGPTIVEEFLPGREFAVSLWGQRTPRHDMIGEMAFRGGLRLNTYASKWEPDSEEYANAPIDFTIDLAPKLRGDILAAARGAWTAVGARGYLRVDVRLNAAGAPFVLDVNANPEIGPGAGICRAVQEAGWTWEDFVRRQAAWA